MAIEAGDIARLSNMKLVTMTAAENITKGDVVTLISGEIADITAAEVGPFGVATADIANTEEGEVAIAPTEIYVEVGTAGITAFTPVMPSEDTGEEGDVADVSTPVYNEVVGMALESGSVGEFKKIVLGYY